MAEENIDIFSDFQEQDFKNSQEYFDYLKKQSEEYRKFKTSPEQVQRDKDAAIDALKFLPNVAAETGNLALNVLELPFDIFDLASGAKSESDKLPRIPTIPYRNPEMEGVDDAAALAIQFMSPFTYLRGIDVLAKSSPKAYKVLSEAHPYFVKQMYEAYKKGGLRAVAETGILPSKEVAKKLARNFSLATGAGLADRITGSTMAENIFAQPVDMPVEKDNVITIQKSDLEADSPPRIRGKEYFETQPEVVDRKAMGGEPGLEVDIFEESNFGEDKIEGIDVANANTIFNIFRTLGYKEATKKIKELLKEKTSTQRVDEILRSLIRRRKEQEKYNEENYDELFKPETNFQTNRPYSTIMSERDPRATIQAVGTETSGYIPIGQISAYNRSKKGGSIFYEPNRNKEGEITGITLTGTGGKDIRSMFDNLKFKNIQEALEFVGEKLDRRPMDLLRTERFVKGGLALGGEPALVENIFEEDTTVAGGPEEIQTAQLLGKTPIWAIANQDKAKTLTQEFSKAAKKAMEAIKNKIGTKDEVLGETIEDVIDTPPAGGTGVGSVKTKKTITDSPEPNEGMFYSELEARLMDPNTPKQFKTADDFLNFLQAKQISKAEVDDNILTRYIELSKKNNYPLVKEDMLEIIRQSPMRSIDTITYGNPAYGGTKNAKYPGYQEPGALPDSYREDVLYLPANKIPFDPDKIPGSVHDFEERYVIGWSRKTDRKATLPVEKTPQGIEEAVDPAMIRTLKRNQKKLDRQLIGLEFSALRKLDREGLVDIDDIDELTTAEIRNILSDTDVLARLRSTDEPLEQQILQFRMKIDEDAARLKKMEDTTKGREVTITFADEIQSDILQQAKQMEQKFREELGDLMDKNIDYVKEAIRSSQAGYSGHFRNINPDIAEYFIKNKTVFRPIFQNETEMQQFMNKYAETQIVLEDLAKAGLRPDKQLVTKAKEARATQQQLLSDLETAMSKESLSKLFPNVPFKNRMEWGSALIKRDLNLAAERLYGPNKVDGAAEWYVVTPANPVKNRYGQSGGTAVPVAQRTKQMKGIGTEEFYGGPNSVDPNGKHYTSTVEKILKKAAKENNSEIKIIEVPNVGKSFAIKITPEMLLPHKTHRKKGGVVYTPELIDIFEVA